MNKIHDVVGPHLPLTIDAAAVAAATATSYVGAIMAPYKCTATAFKMVVPEAVNGAATNYKCINIIKRTGTTNTEVAHVDLDNGVNLAIGTNTIAMNSGTTVSLAEGDYIFVEYEKQGSGLALPAAKFVVEIKGA